VAHVIKRTLWLWYKESRIYFVGDVKMRLVYDDIYSLRFRCHIISLFYLFIYLLGGVKDSKLKLRIYVVWIRT
jgi:hypothetical protein